jgi:hypothetical protein
MIIPSLWSKINVLVPAPICWTQGDEYDSIIWKDGRSKPTVMELQAITEQEILDSQLDQSAENTITGDFKIFLFNLLYNLESRIRVIEAKPTITKVQYKSALITAYKAL